MIFFSSKIEFANSLVYKCESIKYAELIIQRSLARVRSKLFFSLHDVLFHPYPHDHILSSPSLGSNPIGCKILFMEACVN